MSLCEAAAYYRIKGLTLWDQMMNIYEKYGFFREGIQTITLKGFEGAQKIREMMDNIRNNPPKKLGCYELMILSEEGLSVYYTRDGSIPDETDTLYTGRLEVIDRTYEKNVLSDRTDIIAPNKWGDAMAPLMKVDKADVIRAVAVDGQGNRSAVSTAVYFIGYQYKAEFYRNYKVISLAVEPDDLFDPARGIYIQGHDPGRALCASFAPLANL